MHIEDFSNYVAKHDLNMLGIQVIQNDQTVLKQMYQEDIPYSIFSAAKSVMTTLVGIAIDEGQLSLEDKPVDVFENHLPGNLQDGFNDLTLRNLLTMASGHGRAYLMEKERLELSETDFIKYFFSQPLEYAPGEKFVYSNASAYIAGCMVENAVGAKLNDYAYEKLFRPMGIGRCEWLSCPMGHTFAPTRLYMHLSDIIKLGELYLGKGIYEGERLVSQSWVEQASTKKIDSAKISPSPSGEDELCGYGYQFWMTRFDGVYRAYGRRGQFIIVIPERNAVVATLADEPNVQGILDGIWETILPQLQ